MNVKYIRATAKCTRNM